MLDFSVSGLCRRHGFGSVTQVCFGISVSNFMCMSSVAVGKGLTIFSYIAFKMAALWFWAMFNCNPPIAPCYPLLWGGVILVDHWSAISSCFYHHCHCYYHHHYHHFQLSLSLLMLSLSCVFVIMIIIITIIIIIVVVLVVVVIISIIIIMSLLLSSFSL